MQGKIINRSSDKEFVMVELAFLNSFLDAVIKIVVLAFMGYLFLILVNLKRLIRKAERSVESVEDTAESVGRMVKWGRILPFTKGDEK